MEKYELTIADINDGVNRFLSYVYASAVKSQSPAIHFIVAGPGAGKSGVELYLKYKFKERGEKVVIVNSDRIAKYHPNYEDVIEELPEDCYRITRQFVRPASPKIFTELRDNKINILNENTFDKGESDINFVKSFKMAGYKTVLNIMATDMYISRLSCFEREARMLKEGDTPRGISKETQKRMYNSFIEEVQLLESMNLCDELNVYKRGENVNKPILIYKRGDNRYKNFSDALIQERKKQRNEILANPVKYLSKIESVKDCILKNGLNEMLTKNSIEGLNELQQEFIEELNREISERS